MNPSFFRFAQGDPSEQQTYLNIELVVHFTKTTPSEQHPSENLLKSRIVKPLFSRISLQKGKICDANRDPDEVK